MGVLQVPCHETTLQVYVSHLPGGYSLTGQTDLKKHVLASKTEDGYRGGKGDGGKQRARRGWHCLRI